MHHPLHECRYYLLAFLLLALSVLGRAQERYVPAEVKLRNGELVRGRVRAPGWALGTERLLFRPSAQPGEPQYLYPADIALMTLDERGFEQRFRGEVVQVLALGEDLPKGKDLFYETDTLLLQALVEGTLGLYYHESAGGRSRYFLEEDGFFQELVMHAYLLEGSGRSIRKRHGQWREQLRKALAACPDLLEELDGAPFDEGRAQKLIEAYNTCAPSHYLSYTRSFKRFYWAPGVLAGGAFTRVSVRDQLLRNPGYGRIVPRLGARVLIHPHHSQGRSGLLLEALYAPFRTVDELDGITVDVDYLQINAGLRQSGVADVFGSMLIGFSYSRQLTAREIRGTDPRVFPENQVGLFGGFSVGGEKLEVSLRYHLNNLGLLSPSAPFFFVQSVELLAGYQF
ncbi:hypothetical protein [Phaeodactylibacter luteus]|uniref:PorT family protein n=1 Tax=Phaeodactylibacter luteus TaxID=1564516 RepID=A0A5C6RIP9_9BACT|nr:hypothetical protein [Phaeodactylibacter luteus]TXB61550.1 hypothetical protein FRY97_18560 [Phaeodactylibacter luteus]